MRVECIDLESHLMQPGLAAPKMVCMSWSDGTDARLFVPWEGPSPHDYFESILRRDDTLLINQHIFYDLGILCAERPHLLSLVFDGLESGRIRCVKVREQLIRIAQGQAKFIVANDDGDEEEEVARTKTRFDLAAIAKRWLGIDLKKEGTWRLSYALLDGVPLAQWPQSAIDYPLTDARVPLQVWAEQEKYIAANFRNGLLPGEIEANCAAWALHLMKCWGVRTCPEAVARLTYEMQQRVLWTTIGLLMPDPRRAVASIMRVGGTRAKPKAVETKVETQRRVTEAFAKHGEAPPMTASSKTFPEGQIKTSRKVLEDSGDETLTALAEHKGYVKILSTYIPRYVARGIEVPITADWNPLVESFRISCAKPNLTNPPRAGNVRECFVARPGTVFVSADFDQAELRSWAQVCLVMFGYSTLAEAFKAGIDPHLKLGAELLGVSIEEATARYADGDKIMEDRRQFSKEPNFGLIGGMGARKFAERAALKKIDLTVDEAKAVRSAWMNTWPEAKQYLDYFARHYDKPGTIIHPITGFVRGDVGYSDGANHCVDFETEALTRRGWTTGDRLTLRDELLTKNEKTGALEWQQLTHINLFPDYTGPLIEFDQKAMSAVTTPDHRWLVRDRRTGKDRCVTTETMSTNGWHTIHRNGVLCVSDAPYTDDFLELVGWFLTDGGAEKTPGSTRIRIYQTKTMNVPRIDALFDRLGIGFTRRSRAVGNRIIWSFTDKPQRGLGKGIAKKLRALFPERLLSDDFVVQLSRRQARLLAETMLLGDGTRSSTQASLCTKTERGADMFQFLLVLAGYASRSIEVDRTNYIGRQSSKMKNIPKMSKSWNVHLYKRDRSQITNKQVRQVKGDGRGVWCPSVPNGYFVARRKKKVFVTGNCFQHLTAIGAKQALWDLSKECHTDQKSVLYGAHPVIHMHDEIFGEISECVGHAGAMRWGVIMKAAMEKWVRDVPIKCTPVLTRRLHKGAKPVLVNGMLVPSKPVQIDGKTKWIADLPESEEKVRAA